MTYNTVRILSRVVEGRARRRHSNRFTALVNAGANSRPAWFSGRNNGLRVAYLPVNGADGADKMVEGMSPWRSLPLAYLITSHQILIQQLWMTSHRIGLFRFRLVRRGGSQREIHRCPLRPFWV
jgi:hypothetical protein